MSSEARLFHKENHGPSYVHTCRYIVFALFGSDFVCTVCASEKPRYSGVVVSHQVLLLG